eukprot:13503927-Alexandrium_andersonii.AAC.1
MNSYANSIGGETIRGPGRSRGHTAPAWPGVHNTEHNALELRGITVEIGTVAARYKRLSGYRLGRSNLMDQEQTRRRN